MPVPLTSARTMFVSITSGRRLDTRNRGEPGRQLARPAVVVRDAGRASCPGRRAPPPRRCPRGGSSSRRGGAASSRARSTTASLPASTAPNGAERLLLSDMHDRVRGRGEVGERDTERDSRVHQSGAVDVDAAAVPLRRGRERVGQLGRQRRPARPRVRVLEDQQRWHGARSTSSSTATGSIRPSGAQTGARLEPRDLDDPHRLGREDVRGGFEHDAVAGLAEREHGRQVRHPAGGHPDRRRLAEQLRHALAELVHRGVLADRRPAELGLPHRLPHLARSGPSRDRSGGRSRTRGHVKPATGADPAGRRCARRRRRRRRR